jgi:hypothetical protein
MSNGLCPESPVFRVNPIVNVRRQKSEDRSPEFLDFRVSLVAYERMVPPLAGKGSLRERWSEKVMGFTESNRNISEIMFTPDNYLQERINRPP